MVLWVFSSFINLFSNHFSNEKINFLYKWSCRQEPSFFVRNVVLVCSSASGMQHCFTVQLYTTQRQPSLSFVYETSRTIRWLKKEKEKKEKKENCHVLTTALLTRGPWEKMVCFSPWIFNFCLSLK
jgi:hypothetical protein